MSNILSRGQTLRELLRFAGPVMAGQLGLMLIGAGDVLVAYDRRARDDISRVAPATGRGPMWILGEAAT
jgi:hypothetical protein